MKYLLLDKIIVSENIINYQSLGKEITLLSQIKSLEVLPNKTQILIFFGGGLDLQRLLDYSALFGFEYKFIVNREEYFNIIEPLYEVHLVDFKIVDGKLIKAIRLGDFVAIKAMERSSTDKDSLRYNPDYTKTLDMLANQHSTNDQLSKNIFNHKNLYNAYLELAIKYKNAMELVEGLELTKFELAEALKINKAEFREFLNHLAVMQNELKSITAMAVVRESIVHRIEPSLTSIYFKDYGMPNLFQFLYVLNDALSIDYNRYTKVVLVLEADGLDIVRVPSYYLVVTEETERRSLIAQNFICVVGGANLVLDLISEMSQFNTLILCDSRKNLEHMFTGETLFLNLIPDRHTLNILDLDENISVSPSPLTKYHYQESAINQTSDYSRRKVKVITQIIDTLLERKGIT